MIVITTPIGRIGRHVVNKLLDSGSAVRLLVRNPDKLEPSVRTRAGIIQGSIDSAEFLTSALDGAEALFWCVPEDHTLKYLLEYYLNFADAAATAIKQTGVSHVVAVSSGGKGRARNAGPISALHAMEETLKATGVAIRYLRCGNFMENLLWQIEPIMRQGIFFYPIPGDLSMPMVAAQDIGATAAKWLVRRDWSGQTGVGVHGPENLSMNQVAERISKVISGSFNTNRSNKPVRFQPVSPKAYYESMLQHGCSPAYAQGLLDMFVEVTEGIYDAEPRTLETTTSTTLEEWTSKILLPLAKQ